MSKFSRPSAKKRDELPFEQLPPAEQAKQRSITRWLHEHGSSPEEFRARCRRLYEGKEAPPARPVDEEVPAKLFDGED